MWLDTTSKSLEILLDNTVTTNQLPWTAAFGEVKNDNSTSAPKSANGVTNNTTADTVVAAPASTFVRELLHFTCFNADTVTRIVTIRLNDGGTFRIMVKVMLATGEMICFESAKGWYVLKTDGSLKAGIVGATGATGSTGPAGPLAIGTAVTGGSANYVLFVDASGNLQQNINFTMDATQPALTFACNGGAGGSKVSFTSTYRTSMNVTITDSSTGYCLSAFDGSGHYARLATQNEGGWFNDGTNTVTICNGTQTIALSGGNLDFNAAGNLRFVSGGTIASDTSTGLQIGTAANQKLSFWGAAAVVQPSSTGSTGGITPGSSGTVLNTDAAATGGIGSSAYTLDDLVKAAKQAGLLAA